MRNMNFLFVKSLPLNSNVWYQIAFRPLCPVSRDDYCLLWDTMRTDYLNIKIMIPGHTGSLLLIKLQFRSLCTRKVLNQVWGQHNLRLILAPQRSNMLQLLQDWTVMDELQWNSLWLYRFFIPLVVIHASLSVSSWRTDHCNQKLDPQLNANVLMHHFVISLHNPGLFFPFLDKEAVLLLAFYQAYSVCRRQIFNDMCPCKAEFDAFQNAVWLKDSCHYEL